MPRSTDTQKAERLNAAHGLLARGFSVAEACVSLSDHFALSRRQAYRYVQEAQSLPAPVPAVEPAVAVTFKLPPSLVSAVRARAARDGTTISETVTRALSAWLAGADGHGS
jgi:predicted DNA-binding transcriptional regulator YafY